MVAVALAPCTSHASFLSGDALDTAANVLSWAVLLMVPVFGITIFWIVHVMPEKIAHKRHHPQQAAIHTLCLLSLVFGGLLWPIAWLWAYTRPVGYKLAYGTEKHEDFYVEHVAKAEAGELTDEHLAHLEEELATLYKRGQLTPGLRAVRERLRAVVNGAPNEGGAG
jgi:hypothetical protein